MTSSLTNLCQLINLIKRVPGERTFLTTRTSTYTYTDVLILSESFRLIYPQLMDKNCAIISNDRESLALLLPAIDNICRNVLLLPKDAKEHEKEFFQAAGIQYVIFLSSGQVCKIKNVSACQSSIRQVEKAYILATSGTTGVPKLASYSLTSLLSTTKINVERGEEFTWGLTYDINRFAGLQVYLQALSSGSAIIAPSGTASISEIIEIFIRSSVNCISATPSFWRKLLMEPQHSKLNLKRITLGGEISNQSVLSALDYSYSSASIVHIYASTEAGVGFVVKDKKEGFPSSYLIGKPDVNCQLKIVDGTLWIKNTNCCSMMVQGDLEIDNDRFINTGDKVNLEEDRVFFLGRESGSINVGGNKVMPEKVESVLEQHPYVLMANVFPKANSLLGALVSCEVIITENAKEIPIKELKHQIFSFCKTKLQPFEMPALLKVVQSIQTNLAGKKVRNK